MPPKPVTPPSNRRAHDRADRRAGWVRPGAVLVSVAAIAALLGGYWWFSQQDVARDGAPGWSPDGRSLVFSAEVGAEPSDIFIMGADGRNRERVASAPGNDSAPAMSTDGRLIAFESDRDGNFEIYVMDRNGGNQRRLTNDPARDLAPAWSPDGTKIAFTSDRDGRATADLYVMQADGSELVRLTSDLANWAPQFSPDGSQIAFQVNRDVHVMTLADRTTRRLTFEPNNGMNPTWSSDGQRIAFVSSRNRRVEIFTMSADGSNQQVLVTMAAGSVIDPRWSPDGTRIAFVLVPEGQPDAPGGPDAAAAEPQAIYTIDLASGTVTRVSR